MEYEPKINALDLVLIIVAVNHEKLLLYSRLGEDSDPREVETYEKYDRLVDTLESVYKEQTKNSVNMPSFEKLLTQ